VRARGERIGYCREAVVVHPVHVRRSRLATQLKLAFFYGWRDPIVFFDPARPLFEPYRARLLLRWGAGAAADFCRGDATRSAVQLLRISRNLGTMTCRWSRAYRRKARLAADPAGEKV
jgi:hypothetical protein